MRERCSVADGVTIQDMFSDSSSLVIDASQVNPKRHIFCHAKCGVLLQRSENFDTKIIIIEILLCAFKALE